MVSNSLKNPEKILEFCGCGKVGTLQDRVQDKVQDKVPDSVKDKVQDKVQDKVGL